MKLLAVFFLLGLALASAIPLHSEGFEIDEIEDELDDEFIVLAQRSIAQRLRERLEGLIERIKKSADEGKGVNGNLMKKAEDIYQKFKNLGFELSEKFKSIFEDLRNKVGRQSPVENADFNIKDIFQKLKKLIKDNFDSEKLKAKIEQFFGKGSEFGEQLLNLLKTKGEKAKNKILELIDRVLGEKEETYLANDGGPLGQRIRERLEGLIERIKKNFDDGKGVNGNLMKKLEDVYQKFKNMGFELSEKFKSIFEDLRNKVGRQRSIENADFNFRDIFAKLKQLIKDKIDVGKLKEQIEKIFGKGSEMADQLLNLLKNKGEKGKGKLLELIDRILGEKEEEKRSIKEIYDKIKEYFKELNIELKERFTNFGEYVKEQYQKVLDKTKTKAENVKRIAREFLDDTRKISKDMAEEALDFFREYKNDLGSLYDDLIDKVREIIKKDN